MEKDKIDKYLDRLRFKDVPTDADKVYNRIWWRIKNESVARIQLGVSPIWRYIAVAASFLVLCFSSLFIYENMSKSDRIEQIAYIEVSGISGTNVKLFLPDSTEVWIGGNTKLRYPQSFSKTSRNIELDGRAFFKVKKDLNTPFIISNDEFHIRVLGTMFNVEMSKDADVIETTLLEGSVAVYSDAIDKEKMLLPNQQALYNKGTSEISISKIDASLYSSWVTGRFVFNKKNMTEITMFLERAFNTKIHIHGRSLQKKVLTAQFVHQETLDEILSILAVSAHYKYEKVKGEIYIRE